MTENNAATESGVVVFTRNNNTSEIICWLVANAKSYKDGCDAVQREIDVLDLRHSVMDVQGFDILHKINE